MTSPNMTDSGPGPDESSPLVQATPTAPTLVADTALPRVPTQLPATPVPAQVSAPEVLVSPFDLAVTPDDPRRTVITLTGELDLVSSPRLGHAIDDLVGAGPVDDVVLDLAGVTFCDVRGLTSVLGAHHAVVQAGGRLAVAGASKMMVRLLTLTGLHLVVVLV